MYSDIEIRLDNMSENLTNFGHETRNLHEKIIKNISEASNVVLEQNYPPDVTNKLELKEADQNSYETLKDLNLEKENLHENIMDSFSQFLEITIEC